MYVQQKQREYLRKSRCYLSSQASRLLAAVMRSTTEVSRSFGSRREDLLSDWLLRRRPEMKFCRFLAEAPSLWARVLTLSVSSPEFYTQSDINKDSSPDSEPLWLQISILFVNMFTSSGTSLAHNNDLAYIEGQHTVCCFLTPQPFVTYCCHFIRLMNNNTINLK